MYGVRAKQHDFLNTLNVSTSGRLPILHLSQWRARLVLHPPAPSPSLQLTILQLALQLTSLQLTSH